MIRSATLVPLLAVALLSSVASLHARGAKWEESGKASWYGGGFEGKRTASGERFDAHAMTAAHSSLPLGSRVRVTMEDTGDSVVVRITDRLPPHGVRIIDLSRGAASRLGMVNRGTAWVSLTPAAPGKIEEVAEAPDDGAAAATPRQHGPRRMRLAGR